MTDDPKEEPKKSRLATVLSDLAEGVRIASRGARPSLRVFAMVWWAFFFFVLAVVMSPWILVQSFRARRQNPVDLVKAAAESAWVAESPQAGAEVFRKVLRELLDPWHRGRLRRIEIKPYGKMGPMEFVAIAWYCYHWEMQIGDYGRAIEVCDAMCRNGSQFPISEEWGIMKARAIRKCHGTSLAIRYLVSLNRANHPMPAVEDELRRLVAESTPSPNLEN